MFDRIRQKIADKPREEPASSSSHKRHRHTHSAAHAAHASHRPRQPCPDVADAYFADANANADANADFVFRPHDTYDASQPIGYDDGSGGYAGANNVNGEMLATLLNKAQRLDKIEALLTDASQRFARCHPKIHGSDAATVLMTLLDSVGSAYDGNMADNCSSVSSSDDGSVISETYSAIIDTSQLSVVIMTKAEHSSWMRLSGLNMPAPGSGFRTGVGRSDWLQPMRQALTEVALSTKRLEIRFGMTDTTEMSVAVQQQHNIERMTIESQYFDGKSVEGVAEASGKARRTPKAASVIVAQITDELNILSSRLMTVQKKAEAGIVPFCRHTLDLGEDRAEIASSSPLPQGQLTRSLMSTIVDPRIAHANAESSQFTMMDVAKGYTLLGLTTDTLNSYMPRPGSVNNGLTPIALANLTWSLCDNDIRSKLGPEPVEKPRWAQPAALLGQWLYASSRSDFHAAQLRALATIVEMARKNRATVKCKCVSSASSSHRHGASSHSQTQPQSKPKARSHTGAGSAEASNIRPRRPRDEESRRRK